ncbi:cbb3-type cytochrome c oxidase subunit I [Flavobacterium hibisci]|uniref:cbb3-type cytochrome c oxidase subunit I n=1 Tax=Flavobacterium hibisci TaxID=1914462 RepID=UPI001CBAE330|nr:cbb3-type cytochrome c oxidase subunit I [Flavobacterium hibisci]MBZ4043769.1 cbb3-type cytochrome c oxidase subunit I [Flavobacterium hibisci]
MNKTFINLRKKIKIYNLFWLVALIILIIGLIQTSNEDTTFDINIHDTYFVIAHIYGALFLSLAYYLMGLGYWIVQKVMKRKLVRVLTIIHSAILNGSFLVYWLVIGYSRAFPNTSFPLFDNSELINLTLVVLTVLILLIGQPIYIINLIIGIFRKRKNPSTKT